MNIGLRMYIYSNPLLKEYIKLHSYLYKDLIRNPESIKDIEDAMKKENHLTIEDKIDKFSNTLTMAETIINTLK